MCSKATPAAVKPSIGLLSSRVKALQSFIQCLFSFFYSNVFSSPSSPAHSVVSFYSVAVQRIAWE